MGGYDFSKTTVYYDLGKSDIFNLSGAYEIGNSFTFAGTWDSLTTYSNSQSVVYNGKVYNSTTNANSNHIPEVANWALVTNNLSKYTLDNGQRDSYYDHGYVKLNTISSPGNTVFVFDYFTHSGGYGYFCSDSYSTIDYSKIPTYVSTKTGQSYVLRDCIDFRPRKTDDIDPTLYNFDYFQIPIPYSSVINDYSFYLSRIDKVVLGYDNKFSVIKGNSSYNNLIPPVDIPNGLTLFNVTLNAYTFNINDVNVNYNEHKRYTMEDIGKLEKRIYNIEYYTALNFLEKDVASSTLTDSNNTQIFNSGFIVDSFTGHGVGDVKNVNYSCSIDFTNKFCRPKFTSNIVQYDLDLINKNYAFSDNIITFPYTEKSFVNQTVATDYTTNINPFNVISFIGNLKLTPSSDIWYDTFNRPIITVINQDNNAWINANNQAGTQWNDWQVIWTGQPVVVSNDPTLQSTQTLNQRTGIQITVQSTNVLNSDTSQIVSSEIIPYARAIDIQFEAFNLPPYTEMFVYANDTFISGYVTPTTNPLGQISVINVLDGGMNYTSPQLQINGSNTSIATASANVISHVIQSWSIEKPGLGYDESVTATVTDGGGAGTGATVEISTIPFMGSPLFTDKNGYCSGIISLPNDENIKIPTGIIKIMICDHVYSTALAGAFAETDFKSKGLFNTVQETVISTRTPVLIRNQVSESYYDAFVTSVPVAPAVNTPGTCSPTSTSITFNGNGTNLGQNCTISTPKNNKFNIQLYGAGYNKDGNDNNSWLYSFSVPGYKISKINLGSASVPTVGALSMSIVKRDNNAGTFTIQMSGYFGSSTHEGYGNLTVEVTT